MKQLEEMLAGIESDPALAALLAGLEDDSPREPLTHKAGDTANRPFDYGLVDSVTAIDAQDVAERCREFETRSVLTVIDLGADLLRIKQKLDRGMFGKWLDAEFGASARVAQLYMSVAERLASNAKHVSYLPLRTVYKLAAPSTPESVRKEIVAKSEAGDRVGAGAVIDMIDHAKAAAGKAARRDSRKAAGRPNTVLAALQAKADADVHAYTERREKAGAELTDIFGEKFSPAEVTHIARLLAENPAICLRGEDGELHFRLCLA